MQPGSDGADAGPFPWLLLQAGPISYSFPSWSTETKPGYKCRMKPICHLIRSSENKDVVDRTEI